MKAPTVSSAYIASCNSESPKASGAMPTIHSFPPIHSPAAERLILGSMPGKASLSAQQYYAHPRNHFWGFMASLLGTPESAPYAERCSVLVANRIALWDVLRACTRSSSLDADIDETSIVTNDFHGFLSVHPNLRVIYFNGVKAEQIYLRYVLPQLPEHLRGIARLRLPSTSPANAAIPAAVKLQQWRVIADGA
jgi:TDG/mug DNA glycosylase family protein